MSKESKDFIIDPRVGFNAFENEGGNLSLATYTAEGEIHDIIVIPREYAVAALEGALRVARGMRKGAKASVRVAPVRGGY